MYLFRKTIPVALVDFIISELEKLILKKKSEIHNLLKAGNSRFPNLYSTVNEDTT